MTPRALVVGCLLPVLMACPQPGPSPDAGPPAARLEFSPATLLLPGVGTSGTLTVKAFDAAGRRIQLPELAFSSSRADTVSVAADGTVQGLALGSGRVTVTSNGVSASASVVVAEVMPGAILITDAQVLGDIKPVDPAATIQVGYRYEVRLKDVPALAVGALVIGTGELPVGGKVVAVAGDTVTLELVPLDELFLNLQLDETIDLKTAPLALNEAMLEVFDVTTAPDGSMNLSLKPGTVLEGARRPKTRAPLTPSFEFQLGPVDCQVTASLFQLSLAKMEINLSPNLSVVRTLSGDRKRVVVQSNAKASVSVKPVLQSQLEGKLTCELEIGSVPIPLPGPIGLVLGFKVPFGVGFELEAKVPVISGVSLEFTRQLTATAEAGLDCTPGCSPVGTFMNTSPPPTATPSPSVDLSLPTSLKAELSFYAYAFAKLEFGASRLVSSAGGAVGVRNLQAELLVLKLGLKLEGKFADQEAQAGDPQFASAYRLLFEAGLEPGQAVADFFSFLKLPLIKLEVKLGVELGASPRGTLEVDRATFMPGDDLNFLVKFQPESLSFPLIGFNVAQVRLYQKSAPGPDPVLVLVGRAPLPEGQTEVSFSGVATRAGTPADFVAFVETQLIDAMGFELTTLGTGPRVRVTLGYESYVSEQIITGYDCPMDNSTRNDASTNLMMMDRALPFTLTAGGSSVRVHEEVPGTFVADLTATLPPPLVGSCPAPNAHNYSEPSTLDFQVMLLVEPLDAGGFTFELGPEAMPSGFFTFASPAELAARMGTPTVFQPAPARNSFLADKPFAVAFRVNLFDALNANAQRKLTLRVVP